MSGVTVSLTAGNETFPGGSYPDNAGHDSVLGTTGVDSIVGGNGNDTLDGSSGDDTLLGELGNDSLLGGSGHDSVLGGDGDDTLGVSGTGVSSPSTGNDTLDGGVGNDALRDEEGPGGCRCSSVAGFAESPSGVARQACESGGSQGPDAFKQIGAHAGVIALRIG